jgi:hypothetical protein
MRIESKCGKYNVNIMDTGHSLLAIANMNMFDSETMSNNSYWFTIGRYKTEKGAVRQSAKALARHGVELGPAEIGSKRKDD